MERRIKPWINKKIIEYIGEEEATLTDFICSKLLAHSSAASILNDITMVSIIKSHTSYMYRTIIHTAVLVASSSITVLTSCPHGYFSQE